MAYEVIYVDPEKLDVGVNVRSDANLDIATIAHSVERDGIQVPLTLRKVGKSYRVVQGHRRRLAAIRVKKENPDAFKKLHPKGIPAFVRDDIISDEDEMRVKVDQGTQQSLRYDCELQRAVSMLMDAGMTEENIVFQLEGLFQELSRSMPSKTRDAIKAERGKDKPDEKAIRKMLLDTYKGKLQAHKRIHACPPCVAAALEYAETGTMPEGFKNLPRHIRKSDVAGLLKAFQEDMGIKDDDGTPKFSRVQPGPAFGRAWSDLLKQKPKADITRPKAMSAKAMSAQLENGTWASKGFQRLTQQHAGKTDVEGLSEADSTLHLVELVQKYAPERWSEFKAAAETIKAGIADGTLATR